MQRLPQLRATSVSKENHDFSLWITPARGHRRPSRCGHHFARVARRLRRTLRRWLGRRRRTRVRGPRRLLLRRVRARAVQR
ncbi:hypothetical protein ACFPRL_15105 [Pseudoclavibacter helvolus]